MSGIPFAGQLTERDFARINALAARKTWLTIGAIAAAMLGAWLTVGGGWREVVRDPVAASPAFVPFVLLAILIYPLQRLAIWRQWRNNKAMQQPVSGSVSEEGITWNIQGVSNAQFAWKLLLRYRASPSLILIYQGLNQVLYFFPHYFSSEQDWSTFKEIVGRHLPHK